MSNIEFIRDEDKDKVDNLDFKFLKDLEKAEEEKKRAEEEIQEAEEEERKEIDRYLQKTSRENAIERLLFNINTIQQGYSRVWETGFTNLDNLLSGGFHEKQLIVLGAVSSLGKTSLALQIADNVARSGKDVLVFSLEMDSDELLAKTISRETYLLSCGDKSKEKYRLTTQDILNGEVGKLGDPKRELFDKAVESSNKINDHLRYRIGDNKVSVSTIKEEIELHRKATGEAPFIILDYLQILKPTEDALGRKLDKRLLTDDDVSFLRTLARDYRIPVVVISAFNRESYLQPVSMSSFRESSGIEYSSDVLLAMQYQGADYKSAWYSTKDANGNVIRKKGHESKQDHEARVREDTEKFEKQDIRPIELVILKNRNGKKGNLYFNFNAKYNCYEESRNSYNVKAVTDNTIGECEKAFNDDDVIEEL